jgi:hypothetical protein
MDNVPLAIALMEYAAIRRVLASALAVAGYLPVRPTGRVRLFHKVLILETNVVVSLYVMEQVGVRLPDHLPAIRI